LNMAMKLASVVMNWSWYYETWSSLPLFISTPLTSLRCNTVVWCCIVF
jgi:hypothetical protein